jgi:Type III restriction enzyme, res subunit
MSQSNVALRDYQLEALGAIAKAEARGARRQILALPTGTGKTIVFAEFDLPSGWPPACPGASGRTADAGLDKFRVVGLAAGVVKAELGRCA